MNFYNIFEMFDGLEQDLRDKIERMEDAKDHARANPDHVACQVVAARANEVIGVYREELGRIDYIRRTTKLKHAIVTHVMGGQC